MLGMKLRTLWDWWLGQLADWVPDKLRHRLGDKRDVLVVASGKGELSAHAVVDRKPYDLGTLGQGPPDRQRAMLLAALEGLPRRPADLELRIQPGEYLRRDFDLPLAAEDNLREAVELQLDRLTPFNPDEVVFLCGVRERDPVAKRLGAWLAAVPATRVQPVLAWLGGEGRLAPRPPRSPPEPGEPLVLRYALRGQRRLDVRWLIAAVSAALLVGAVAVHLRNRDAELEQLQAAVAEVRRDADEASQVADSLEAMRAAVASVQDRRTGRPPLVEVLEEVSVRLPDDTYLQRFEVHQGEVRLFGISAAASNLIRLLEDSPLLADVRFESSVTRDAATGKERFNIVARMEREGQAAPAPGGGS